MVEGLEIPTVQKLPILSSLCWLVHASYSPCSQAMWEEGKFTFTPPAWLGTRLVRYVPKWLRPHLTFLVSTSSCRMHCSKVHKVRIDSYHLCALLASALQGTPPVLLRTPPPNLFTLCGTTTGFTPPHCCWWREDLFCEAGGALRCLSSREMCSTSTSSHM